MFAYKITWMKVDSIETILALISAVALVISLIVLRMLIKVKSQQQIEIDSLKSKLQKAEADTERARSTITGEFKQLLSDQRAITASGTTEQLDGLMKGLQDKIAIFESQNAKRISDLENRQANMPNPGSLVKDLKTAIQEDIERLQVRQSAVQEQLKRFDKTAAEFVEFQKTFPNRYRNMLIKRSAWSQPRIRLL